MAGTLSRTVINMRSMVDEIDRHTLKNIPTRQHFVLHAPFKASAIDPSCDVMEQLVLRWADLTAPLAANFPPRQDLPWSRKNRSIWREASGPLGSV